MAFKSGRLLAELRRESLEVESKGYNNKTLRKKANAWEEIFQKFNSRNPNGIRRDMNQIQGCWRREWHELQSKKEYDLQRREARKTGGGKVPASPSKVSKLVADVIPTSVNPLEQPFDDDAGEEPNSRRDKDERDSTICEAGPSVLADVEIICRKEAKLTKKEDSQKYSKFWKPQNVVYCMIIYYKLNIIIDRQLTNAIAFSLFGHMILMWVQSMSPITPGKCATS